MSLLADRAAGLTALLLLSFATPSAGAHELREFVDAFAGSQVASGAAVGIGVAVVVAQQPTRFFTYGRATLGPGAPRPFTPDTLFQLGSVTKVFTTNLLGQAVHAGKTGLDRPLRTFQRELGQLPPLTGAVTLRQLGSFTGGIADLAPRCPPLPPTPGCLPSERPTSQQYPARQLAAFFRNTVPTDYEATPPEPVSSVPAPYFYSDFSTGLIGLLLGGTPGSPLTNAALDGWQAKVKRQILQPLGMARTFLHVPAQALDVAAGYVPAQATPTVTNGQITQIDLVSGGDLYVTSPAVRILGGGGSGSSAQATVTDGVVRSIAVVDPGQGYLAPARVTFNGAGATEAARAQVVVRDGKVVAVAVLSGGSGYFRVPTVTITGGRAPGGRDATAIARIVDGTVGYLSVVDGGAGYAQPLAVAVAPGAAAVNAIPIWAPAGALSSTLRDMGRFARAALGERRLHDRPVPEAITAGFRIARRPYACAGSEPSLAGCLWYQERSALAWAVQPADPAAGVPTIVSKNGGIAGFSTEVVLMPQAGLAVVVFVNSRSYDRVTGMPERPAVPIARNVLYGLLDRRSR